MPAIKHGDREIHYENNELIPHIKMFRQDFSPLSADSDFDVSPDLGGQAKLDFESQDEEHISRDYAYKPFPETLPSVIPSLNYIIYKGNEKNFPYMDAIYGGGIVGRNQLIVSFRLMGLLQKYRMAPHITIPVIVKHRDTYIDDYYVMVYFWQHGCDLVQWEETIFAWVDSSIFQNIKSTFVISSFDDYKQFRKKPPIEQYIPLSICFQNKYDIFYCDLGGKYVSHNLSNQIKAQNYKNVCISGGGYFETLMKS